MVFYCVRNGMQQQWSDACSWIGLHSRVQHRKVFHCNSIALWRRGFWMLESSTATGIQQTFRGHSCQIPTQLVAASQTVCWTITWAWLVLGSGTEQKVAGRSSLGKGGENGFTADNLPTFPVPYSSPVIPAANIPPVLFQPCLLFHINLFFLVLYTLSFFSCYLQKFMRKFHSSVTWLVFSLYAHSARFFPVLRTLASPISLTAEKWRCGLYQIQVCSIYTVQLQRLAPHSELQALEGGVGGS